MNIKSTSKLGLVIAASFLTLGALSAPAFAESTEFRRGYEQGFQDARDGRNQQHGQYQNSRRRISIERARYGTRGRTCDAVVALQRAVDSARDRRYSNTSSNGRYDNNGYDNRNNSYSRRDYQVVAGNQLCGDPSPNRE